MPLFCEKFHPNNEGLFIGINFFLSGKGGSRARVLLRGLWAARICAEGKVDESVSGRKNVALVIVMVAHSDVLGQFEMGNDMYYANYFDSFNFSAFFGVTCRFWAL